MGTPIRDPVDSGGTGPGNNCSVCWGSGKAFGDVDTPDKIFVTFSGVNKASDWASWMDEPLNERVELSQDAFAPCHFYNYFGNYMVDVTFLPTFTEIIVECMNGGFQFVSPSSDPCSEFVFNEQNTRFTWGSAMIEFPEV